MIDSVLDLMLHAYTWKFGWKFEGYIFQSGEEHFFSSEYMKRLSEKQKDLHIQAMNSPTIPEQIISFTPDIQEGVKCKELTDLLVNAVKLGAERIEIEGPCIRYKKTRKGKKYYATRYIFVREECNSPILYRIYIRDIPY